MTTAQLVALAYPRPGLWQKDFHRDVNFGSRVRWLQEIDRRVSAGMYVDTEQLQEAEVEAGHIRRWRRLTEPVESLAFQVRRAG
jgi:hypothetical protein